MRHPKWLPPPPVLLLSASRLPFPITFFPPVTNFMSTSTLKKSLRRGDEKVNI